MCENLEALEREVDNDLGRSADADERRWVRLAWYRAMVLKLYHSSLVASVPVLSVPSA